MVAVGPGTLIVPPVRIILNTPPVVVPESMITVLPGAQTVSAARLTGLAAPATSVTLRGLEGLAGSKSSTLLVDATVVLKSPANFASMPLVLAIEPPERMTLARRKSGFPAIEL